MKKKILFIQENLQGGGAEKSLINLLNHIDYTNYSVELVLVFKYGVYLDKINSNVKVYYLMDTYYPRIIAIILSHGFKSVSRLYLRYLLLKKLRFKKYDTIISFMEGISALVHNMVRRKATKNISWVHTDLLINNWCINTFQSLIEQKKIYNNFDTIVCVSKDSLRSFNKLFNTNHKTYIYNIVDIDQIKADSIAFSVKKNNITTVLTVGRLTHIKNQTMLVEAANILKKKGIYANYWILGEGEDLHIIQQQVKKYNLESYFCFWGFQDNPFPYIKCADIITLPSLAEGLSLVVCEALCLAKPILSTKTSGPTELLENGAGLLSEINVNDFSQKLELLIKRKDLRNSLSKSAKKRSEIFSIDKTMKCFYSTL